MRAMILLIRAGLVAVSTSLAQEVRVAGKMRARPSASNLPSLPALQTFQPNPSVNLISDNLRKAWSDPISVEVPSFMQWGSG